MSKADVNINAGNTAAYRLSLTQMKAGQKGRIVEINGGCALVSRLDALGIRVGKKIKKISEQWLKGPVLFQYDNTQVALGFGMASKILVQI